jgi:peptidylamidoglycolate lyase
MSRTPRVLLATLIVVLASLYVEAQTGGYQLVINWMKLPKGYILGTPTPAPTTEEMAVLRARGDNGVSNISAFAGVAVDSHDHVYAFHRGQEKLQGRFPSDLRSREHPLVVFDADGKFLKWAADGVKGGFVGPHMIDVDADDNVWVVERNNHRIIKLTRDQNTIALQLGTTGEPGADATHFNLPTDIAWSKNGDIFVTDGYGNNRVVKYTKDGKFIKQWGGGPESKGSADGQFNLPHGIVIDWQDHLFVLDRENRRVQSFDTEGKFLGKWTDIGYNWGIAIGRDGARDGFAYLSNVGDGQVTKVRMADGKIVARWGGGVGRAPGQLDGAHDIAVDSKGAVYVADTWGQRVQKFVSGTVVATLGGQRPEFVPAQRFPQP